MEWYKLVLSKYSDFEGRARRSEYWYFVLFNALIAGGILIVDMMLWERPILYILYAIFIILPSLAVAVRRLHDINRSGWWLFISLVPIVGAIMLLIFYVTEGDVGDNQFGPDPKSLETDDISQHLV